MLEISQVRKKSRTFVAKKNLMIFLFSFTVFFVIGYAFAYGGSNGGVIGGESNYVGVMMSNNLFHER